MIENYPRQLFDYDWYCESMPALIKTFSEFKPRSDYISNNKQLFKDNQSAKDPYEHANILSYPTKFYPNTINGIESFDKIFANNSKFYLMKEKFSAIENYIDQYIISAKTTFLTFSTAVTGAKHGVKHLHPLINDNSCDVWSFCLPLYIDTNHMDQNPEFCLTSQEELFQRRYYLDYDCIRKANLKYGGYKIPLDDKIFSIRFDAARSPHYIDYKPHVFVWFVFDGIKYKDQTHRPVKTQFFTELL